MRFVALLALLAPAVGTTFPAAAPAPKAGPPRLIAVASNKDGAWGVYLVLPVTGESQRLTDPKSDAYGLAWSPDGTRIAFISERTGEPEIWTMKPDGADARQLTNKLGVYEGLQWSPDGSWIAFVQSKDRDRVLVIDPTTGKHKVVVDEPSGYPTWSSDGKRLLHVRYTPTSTAYSCKPDGTDARQLSDGGGFEPVWSPDGTRLAYTGMVPAEKAEWYVFTAGADGKGERQLETHPADNYGVFPRWSPDGNRIAYTGTVNRVHQVGVIDAIGGESKIITAGPLAHAHPQWSPDGKSLAYLRTDKQKRNELIVSAADGSDAKVLLADVGQCIAWKPK